MSKVKIVLTVLTIGGIAGLTGLGIETGPVVTLGVGLGTLIVSLIAIIKKK